MIKAIIILLFVIPFIYLGYKSLDVSVDKRRKGSTYIVKEYPVFLLGILFFGVAGIIVANIKNLLAFL
ncbi:hypothetical protein [Kordia jejudonensis]|uniref:hypothetical protein n=1 Tax=Kordia jejudonensis TaxID=1348245 RepID=UPI000629A807|nr:hypothetical protein [Kordia jejudonensis]